MVKSIELWGREIPVYSKNKLINVENCIVLIASSNYMWEIAEQLEELNPSDTVECYSFGLILAVSCGKDEPILKQRIFDQSKNRRIPKIIHTFWFSGENKPKEYLECIDSWFVKCPDYKIIEWTYENYDIKKNKFCEESINKRKWAFATDYARLDVLWNYGGIYLDSDMELVSSLDSLLGNKAFFSFDPMNDIEMCVFGSEPHNPVLYEMLGLYENIDFSIDKMNALCQPHYIRPKMEDLGVELNGDMQIVDENVFLPRCYFTPIDTFIYEMIKDDRMPIGIHHFNSGWKNNDYKKNRIENNRKLMNKIRNQR
jgi:hypothetical protein